jgi:vacuolar protein sorting-associated protein VTA1
MSIPASLKLLIPFIKRAEELEKDSNASEEAKVVAYYCRVHAVTEGSKLGGGDPEVGAFLIGQMDMLEKLKPTLNSTMRTAGYDTCSSFAQSLFRKADDEDRAGAADKGTAKLYYSAGTFFDTLKQFNNEEDDTAEFKKYAKYRATEILGAIKRGERPEPGGFKDEVGILIITHPRPLFCSLLRVHKDPLRCDCVLASDGVCIDLKSIEQRLASDGVCSD